MIDGTLRFWFDGNKRTCRIYMDGVATGFRSNGTWTVEMIEPDVWAGQSIDGKVCRIYMIQADM